MHTHLHYKHVQTYEQNLQNSTAVLQNLCNKSGGFTNTVNNKEIFCLVTLLTQFLFAITLSSWHANWYLEYFMMTGQCDFARFSCLLSPPACSDAMLLLSTFSSICSSEFTYNFLHFQLIYCFKKISRSSHFQTHFKPNSCRYLLTSKPYSDEIIPVTINTGLMCREEVWIVTFLGKVLSEVCTGNLPVKQFSTCDQFQNKTDFCRGLKYLLQFYLVKNNKKDWFCLFVFLPSISQEQ